jgi:orotate phosphoribosyltransferase
MEGKARAWLLLFRSSGRLPSVEKYVEAFIELLVECDVIRFGEFTLKSGRTSPYFINSGQLRTGDAIARLGVAFAERINHHGAACDLVFGPAYKGVPLAVGTAMAIAMLGRDVGYAFDRKEAKDHGEGGVFVGMQPADGMRVVVVDDVITSGQSIRESVTLLRNSARVEITAVVVAVDRMERGRGERSTLAELRDELGVAVLPVVDIRGIVQHLHGREIGGRVVLDDKGRAAIETYLRAHEGLA